MANMSYCRFQNTLRDLRDCYDALADLDTLDALSSEEKQAAHRLMKLCVKVVDYGKDAGVLPDE